MRKISNEDVKKYIPMVESYIRQSVVKNWREASTAKDKQDIALGNTGWTMRDIRQYLLTEVFVALTKYNPNYRTAEGRSVKESSFVCGHIIKRIGSLCKRLTKRKMAYGVWGLQIEKVLKDIYNEEV
jgi:hypothetical protein